MFPAVVALALGCASTAAAQHGYSAEDIAAGAKFYASTCAGCHGPEGTRVAGVDLGGGQFRRATTDDDLVRIIRLGIPDTSMPASSFSERDAGAIVAYLRTMKGGGATVVAGDAQRGRAIFDGAGKCGSCHGSGGPGSRLAPVLAEIASVRRPAEIERAILDPSAELAPDFRLMRVVTREGTVVTGRLLNQDTFSLQLLDASERLRSFDKATLREHAVVPTSPMPSYRGTLTSQEVADLVAYVRSLGGKP
jgi:putative heme-binding domain-containing protein